MPICFQVDEKNAGSVVIGLEAYWHAAWALFHFAITAGVVRTMAARPQLPGNRTLKEADPEIYALVEEEKARSMRSIELIASENFTSRAVMECLGSVLTNK